jgi:hypothetical protein
VNEMLQWTITCGRHVLLRQLLATRTALAVLQTNQRADANGRQAGAQDKDHPAWWAVWSGSEPTVDVVSRHAGVPPAAITLAFSLGSPLAVIDILVRRFIAHEHEALFAATADESLPITPAWHVEQLDEALSQKKKNGDQRSSSKLFLLAGQRKHAGLMGYLLARCRTEAKRQELLHATNHKNNTGT